MARYYYNPTLKRFHSNILHARNWAMHQVQIDPEMGPMMSVRAGNWSKLESDEWCKAHPDIASCWLDVIPTRTRSMAEVKLRMWMYRLIKKKAAAPA